MLTPRQNLLETINGGHPDRFVKQFEFLDTMALCSDPWNATNPVPYMPGGEPTVDYWGITWIWPKGILGMFPLHDMDHKVLKDVTRWPEIVKAPPLDYSDALWDEARQTYDVADRTQYFAGPMMFPGIFETLHSLMGMDDAMIALYEEPEAVKELIDYIVEWECSYAKLMAENLHFDAVFHHDDWGSKNATFMSVDMFREFFFKPYQRLYGTYRECGAELIVHHSDSYGVTLVPTMLELGIDIWQGATESNDIRKLIDEYGGRLSIMSGIESALVDVDNWSTESIENAVSKACDTYGKLYFIPCQTTGGPGSTFEGVYEAIDAAIDQTSTRCFV